MTAAKATQGPWRIQWEATHGAAVYAPQAAGVGVAWCGGNTIVTTDGSYSINAEEAAANARLIAAAPSLLDALKACARLVLMSDGANAPAYQNALAAIRLAEVQR